MAVFHSRFINSCNSRARSTRMDGSNKCYFNAIPIPSTMRFSRESNTSCDPLALPLPHLSPPINSLSVYCYDCINVTLHLYGLRMQQSHTKKRAILPSPDRNLKKAAATQAQSARGNSTQLNSSSKLQKSQPSIQATDKRNAPV